jgi:hypothetical protein
MVTFECPWCAEPSMIISTERDEVTCSACDVRAELADDPSPDRIAQAA